MNKFKKTILSTLLILGTSSFAMAGNLTIILPDIQQSRGNIKLSFTPIINQDKFPSDESGYIDVKFNGKTENGIRIKAKKGTMKFTINIPNGIYAIAGYHDLNSNDELDKIPFMGIPTEAYGFSNNPFSTFGPPTYKAAQFELNGDDTIEIELQ